MLVVIVTSNLFRPVEIARFLMYGGGMILLGVVDIGLIEGCV